MILRMLQSKLGWTIICIYVMSLLSSCSNNNYAPVMSPTVPVYKPGEYYVRHGDTLFSIAWAYGLDYRTLEKINGIRPGEQIQPGQYLIVKQNLPRQKYIETQHTYLTPTTGLVGHKVKTMRTAVSVKIQSTKSAPVGHWIWPVTGKIIEQYAPMQGNKGINIAGIAGTPIRAAAAGIVVYAGAGLAAYGKLIILKNNNAYLSAYAHNQTILVKEGDKVRQGQVIAKMGHTGSVSTMLHFEIRKNGQPVDPLLYLKY